MTKSQWKTKCSISPSNKANGGFNFLGIFITLSNIKWKKTLLAEYEKEHANL